MTSEGLGEVFKGDSADACAVSMGGQANGQACAEGERGPPQGCRIFFVSDTVAF